MKESTLRNILPAMHLLKAYHRHQVIGTDNIPLYGPSIVLTNHSLATYDGLLLGMTIYLETGRMPYGLGDTNLFKLPFFRKISPRLNMVEANHPNAERLLAQGEILCIAPGGMREALRSSHERHRIMWERRTGFARLSIKTKAPILLAACPAADEIYNVHTNVLTKLAYKKLKLPFVIANGIGPTLVPRPVKLTHYISRPLYPPSIAEGDPHYLKALEEFHHQVIDEMETLMKKE